MDGPEIVKREQEILTGVAEKIGATLGSVAAGAQTVGKRLTTAATEAGKAYRATMKNGKPRRKRTAAKKTSAKRAVSRAASRVKRAPLKTRSAARRSVRNAAAKVRRARKGAASKPARRSRTRR